MFSCTSIVEDNAVDTIRSHRPLVSLAAISQLFVFTFGSHLSTAFRTNLKMLAVYRWLLGQGVLLTE